MQPALREYQRAGIRHLLKNDQACLLWDPGLGKTLATLLAYHLIEKKEPGSTMLIIAPLMVAKTVWQDEVKKWAPLKDLKIGLLHGSNKAKTLNNWDSYDICVINYEGLPWLDKQFKNMRMPWETLVLDELSKCKDISTSRHKILRRIAPQFKRRWGLTGTFAPNSIQEMFGQMLIIDRGEALGTSITRFRNKYLYKEYPASFKWLPQEGAPEKIATQVAPTCHRLSAKKHLVGLPPRYDIWHPIKIPNSAMEVYKSMEEEQIIELSETEAITAMSAGVVWGKLQQIAQGFSYWFDDEDQRHVENYHQAKLAFLKDLIEEANGSPVLVMYKYNEDLLQLRDAFPEAGMMDGKPETVRAWNAGEYQVMLAQPQSAGHGLNLQAGGHIMVWYCLESSNERYIQGCGRLHRGGQQHPVVVHHLMASSTVDEDSKALLEGRATLQELVLQRIAYASQSYVQG